MDGVFGTRTTAPPDPTAPPQPGKSAPAPTTAPPPPPPAASISLAQGPAAPAGYRYAIALNHFPANANITVTCHDSVTPGGFYTFTMHTDGSGSAFTQSQCYSGDGPDHWARANGIESNHVGWTAAAPPPPPPPPPPAASISLAQGPAAPAGYRYAIRLNHFPANANITVTCHDSVDPGGFYTFTMHTDGSGSAFTQSQCYSGDHPDHWVRANGIESNHVSW